MRLLEKLKSALYYLLTVGYLVSVPAQVAAQGGNDTVQAQLPFTLPTLTEFLTFLVRFFFVLAGLAALIFLLLGAFAWITSGGNKENVEKARDKIVNALAGVVIIVLVVVILATFEHVVFSQKICFGITCNITVPNLISPK